MTAFLIKFLQDRTIKDYDKVLELCPKNFKAYKGRAMIYSELQEYERAIEELNKCIEIYPELNFDDENYYNLAILRRKL